MTQIRFENMDMLIFVVSVGFVVVSLTMGMVCFPFGNRLRGNIQCKCKFLLCHSLFLSKIGDIFSEFDFFHG